jgi:hypothetical protein
MAILADFADLLPHDITWEERTGQDSYGKPTYAAAVAFKARVDYRRRNFVNAQGRIIETRGEVIVGGTPAIDPEDKVTIPGGEAPQIMDAFVVDDDAGVPYYTHVIFG